MTKSSYSSSFVVKRVLVRTAETTWLNPSSCFYAGLCPAARPLAGSYRINSNGLYCIPLIQLIQYLLRMRKGGGTEIVDVCIEVYPLLMAPVHYIPL